MGITARRLIRKDSEEREKKSEGKCLVVHVISFLVGKWNVMLFLP
jgi:hypothetical protein